MSVQTWKRIITISVILIILCLLTSTISFGLKYSKSKKELKELNETAVLASNEDGYFDVSEDENFFRYIHDLSEKDASFDYETSYPDLYVDNDFQFAKKEKKVCYLTFDDGPNRNVTPQVLDTLKKYKAKATFFVVHNNSKKARALYKRMVDEGHTIGVHTYSHDYEKIYASVDAYLDDFAKMSDEIEDASGVKPTIFRFPGGSINTYNRPIYRQLISEMTRRGYVYYDWNYSTEDATAAGISQREIVNNVLNNAASANRMIVLLHDGPGHEETAAALPDIIKGLKKQGYTLEALDNSVMPVFFGY